MESSKSSIFVLMPFNKRFNDVYNLAIKALENKLDVVIERADKLPFDNRPIYDQIISEISSADVLIADLSENNPNVYYELGYAHSLGKIVVSISSDDLPFDLAGFSTIFYKLDELSQLKINLELRVNESLELFGSRKKSLSNQIPQIDSQLLTIVKEYAIKKAIQSNWSRPDLYFSQDELSRETHMDMGELYLILDTLRSIGAVTAVNWKGETVWMATQ